MSQGIKSAACRKGIYMDKRGDGHHDCRKTSKSKESNLAVENDTGAAMQMMQSFLYNNG